MVISYACEYNTVQVVCTHEMFLLWRSVAPNELKSTVDCSTIYQCVQSSHRVGMVETDALYAVLLCSCLRPIDKNLHAPFKARTWASISNRTK